MKKVTTKKTRSVNNRPNCLKITKSTQKVNLLLLLIKMVKKLRLVLVKLELWRRITRKLLNEMDLYPFFYLSTGVVDK